jgi:poly(glycerol-phosphate) alpha-glucosyltransferase
VTSISRASGGLQSAVCYLSKELLIEKVYVHVLSIKDDWSFRDLPLWHPLDVTLLDKTGPAKISYSFKYFAALNKLNIDVIHCHGLWQYQNIVARAYADRRHKALILSPHGMLDSWALQNNGVVKKIAWCLFEHRNLNSALCLRALCLSEALALRQLGLKNPIALIPNGIYSSNNLPLTDNNFDSVPWYRHVVKDQKVLLFLSRLHPKKGLVNLLRAWAKISKTTAPAWNPHWVLCIAGWNQDGHEQELKSLASELNLSWVDIRESIKSEGSQIIFLGPQFGISKQVCYKKSDAFILPSFSEGLPMVVLEAWAYSKPVLMTQECNLPEGFECGASIPITTHTDGIEEGLKILFNSSTADLKEMGEKGRKLVSEKFSWSKVATEMKKVYSWMLGGGTPPDCIIS